MDCPRCSVALVSQVVLEVEVDRCSRCAGVWLDRGEAERASRPTGRFAASLRPAEDAPTRVAVDEAARVACPRCRRSCFRERYTSTAVEIDRCACGVWLDHGELDKLVATRQRRLEEIGPRMGVTAREALEREYARGYLDLM